LKKQWNTISLLEKVALTFNLVALIDTGALVTGLSNAQVAHALLAVPKGLKGMLGVVYLDAKGLKGMLGVVYLDENDNKMFLSRHTGETIGFSSSVVTPLQRFVFFDQVHTTGMDIAQSSSRRAAITLGMDMHFRDYSQGAYRMRRLGKGQRLLVLYPSSVGELIKKLLRVFSALRSTSYFGYI